MNHSRLVLTFTCLIGMTGCEFLDSLSGSAPVVIQSPALKFQKKPDLALVPPGNIGLPPPSSSSRPSTSSSTSSSSSYPTTTSLVVRDTQAPSIPGGLKVAATNYNRVDLSWNPSTDNVGVTAYRVYRGAGSVPASYAMIASVGGNSTLYSDSSVTASSTYSYTVDAIDAAGNFSLQSAAVSATTPASPPLGTACPNEPVGWTVLTDRHFPNGADPDWSSVSSFSAVQDSTAPDGDGWLGRMIYHGPGLRRVGSGTMSSIYTATAIKGRGYKGFYHCVAKRMSPTFQTSPNNAPGTKQYWYQFGNGTNAAKCSENRVFTVVYGPAPSSSTTTPSWGTYPLYPGFCHQCLATATGTQANSSGFFYNKNVSIQRGAWYWEEFMGHVESAHGTCDGWLAMYANGQLVKRVNGLCFTFPNEALELGATKWNNTIGGGIAPCTNANWKPANGAASQVIGGVTYYPNNGVLPTAAQHPECFYPQNESIDIDSERILVNTQ